MLKLIDNRERDHIVILSCGCVGHPCSMFEITADPSDGQVFFCFYHAYRLKRRNYRDKAAFNDIYSLTDIGALVAALEQAIEYNESGVFLCTLHNGCVIRIEKSINEKHSYMNNYFIYFHSREKHIKRGRMYHDMYLYQWHAEQWLAALRELIKNA